VAAPASLRPHLVRFGVFELDVRSGELRKAGVRVTLQDQPFKLLECLLERPGDVVTREELRGRLWPGDTFVDFEQGVNAAVKRLREALADSADSPRFIQTLPRRGYRFIAPVEHRDETPAGAGAPSVSSAARAARVLVRFGWSRAAAVVVGGLVIAAGWALMMRPGQPGTAASLPAPQLLPLTTLNGSEDQPTFSPDGRQVAFAWDGGEPDNADIYVTLVGSSEVRRLTADAGRDFAPQWSPDGRHIAYVRAGNGASPRIRVMSALGGSDRELSEFPVWAPIAWTPDGRFIAAGREDASEVGGAHAIYLIPVVAGEPRPLTRPEGHRNDWSPAFSPDGRRLAYASCADLVHRAMCHLQVVDLDAALAPVGPPRRLTPDAVWTINGITWTRDGAGVIYSARQSSRTQLWRVDATAARPPERIDMAAPDVVFPDVAPTGDRLAYAQSTEDWDIYRLEPPGAAQPIARSSARESLPHISPDGRRMAFCSARSSDAFEIWVAGLDGSRPERLTYGPGQWQCSPAWSPDGLRIAFDSRAPDGSWHVWTISADGGLPQQMTMGAGDQVRPSWSRDGRWMYFVWDNGPDRDIWRTRGPAGPTERVTHGGANRSAGQESTDGTGIWYQREPGNRPLFFQPLAGGAARPVIPCIRGSGFSIAPGSVYYVPCTRAGDSSHDAPIRVFNVTTGEDRFFTTLTDVLWPAAGHTSGHFVISPNGRTILHARLASREADLMVIEHFR
jgi:Tol biopolymer transport system component/DNA-binding winged helix-turn-helix (wHTH) protein